MVARTLVWLCWVVVLVVGQEEANANQSDTPPSSSTRQNLLVLTVRREGKEATERFLRSAKIYGYNVKFLGEGEEAAAEGQRRTALELMKEEVPTIDDDNLVLFTESVDVIFGAGPVRLVEEFEACRCEVYVSADGFCWPDNSLQSQYPRMERGKRFLNAGGFIARAGTLKKLLAEKDTKKNKDVPDKKITKESAQEENEDSEKDESLQRLFVKIYLNDAARNQFKMKIDHLAMLFQNLDGATGDVEMRWAGKEGYLQNTLYNTVPVVIRGNRHSTLVLHRLGSYLARSWNPEDGCRSCWDHMKSLEGKEDSEHPQVTMGIFVEKPAPFFQEFLMRLDELAYPKSKIDLYVHSATEYHDEALAKWVETAGPLYASVKFIPSTEKVKGWHARNEALSACVEKDCDYFFSVEGEAHLDNPFTLKLLIEQNRQVVAPMLIRPYKAWSNFWGAITQDGFYSRSMDYMDIVQNKNRGLWNVPYIAGSYLVKRNLLDDPKTRPSFINNLLDPDMAFCENLREMGVFMYVSNRVDFGHLVNGVNFNPERMNPELWEVFENRWDWERRYLHPNFSIAVAENTTIEMPCPDVYWFPLFTERYTKDMIQTFEDFGVWSDGSSTDPRLEGGYESVPTIDIHMKQMRMEDEWLEILRSYIQPIQLKVFQGYNNDQGPPRAIMNFMVRYKPDEQPFLRPHHDTSTYTINVALNRPGIDYEGGGCRFVRYNCSVTDSRPGWILMHPGRLTHLHEGLLTTAGTRYIIVSFIDP